MWIIIILESVKSASHLPPYLPLLPLPPSYPVYHSINLLAECRLENFRVTVEQTHDKWVTN